jgi:hypothetical protein
MGNIAIAVVVVEEYVQGRTLRSRHPSLPHTA